MRNDAAPLVMAGVWQDWEMEGQCIKSCAIVTAEANRKMAEIHHRLPVILGPAEWSLWLGEVGKGAARLMFPVTDDILDLCRVSDVVNSNRATGSQLW